MMIEGALREDAVASLHDAQEVLASLASTRGVEVGNHVAYAVALGAVVTALGVLAP